jgi:hypothetical protein
MGAKDKWHFSARADVFGLQGVQIKLLFRELTLQVWPPISNGKSPLSVTLPTLLPNPVASLALAFGRHAKVDEAEPA